MPFCHQWLAKTPNAPESLEFFRSAAVELPACLSSSDPSIWVVVRRFHIRAVLEMENLSVCIIPRCSPEKRRGRALSGRSLISRRRQAGYFLTFAFLARAAEP